MLAHAGSQRTSPAAAKARLLADYDSRLRWSYAGDLRAPVMAGIGGPRRR